MHSTPRQTARPALPVYRGEIGDIVGVAYRKDLDMGQVQAEDFDLARIMRPPAFIPESTSAGEALKEMQSTRVHFVLVINEHGSIEGIVTLEDLLEEIVGEINDEFDEEVKEQIKQEEGSFVLDGMLAIRAANQRLSLKLPENQGYTTIAGFLMFQAGRVLNVGDEVEDSAGTFRVERVDGRRIRRVRFLQPLLLELYIALLDVLVGPLAGPAR